MNDLESVLRRVIREEVRSALEEMLPPSQSQPSTPTSEPAESLLLSTREAAKRLSISERTLYQLTKSGKLPCVRLGLAKRYSVETIKTWIQKAEEVSASNPNPQSHWPAISHQSRLPNQPSVAKCVTTKSTKKKPKRRSSPRSLVSPKTTQRRPVQEDPKPLKLLLKEMELEWEVLSEFSQVDLLRISEVDIPTFYGWRYLGRPMPEEAVEKLRRCVHPIQKPE